MNKFFKKFLFMLLLMLSPIAIFGGIYITLKLLSGSELMAAFSSFKTALQTLIPYFPYLIIIPAALFILAYLVKNKIKKVI